MGIINVTPDSFFNASRTPDECGMRQRVDSMVAAGADCLDIGGYSSRPGAADIPEEEEWRRVDLALSYIRTNYPEMITSVDTFRASVARKAVEKWGADIINDISGGDLDPEMWPTVAELGVAYVLMHMRGNPSTMQSLTDYHDVTAEVVADLALKAAALRSLGVADIILDPGFGFAKTAEQNFKILADFNVFTRLGMPVLAGCSRKSMIWRPLGITPEESLPGTIALHTVALMKGADIIRVHDVEPAVHTVKLLQMMKEASK